MLRETVCYVCIRRWEGGERGRERERERKERERERGRGREIIYTNSLPDIIIFNNGNLKHVHCTKIELVTALVDNNPDMSCMHAYIRQNSEPNYK